MHEHKEKTKSKTEESGEDFLPEKAVFSRLDCQFQALSGPRPVAFGNAMPFTRRFLDAVLGKAGKSL